MAYDYDSLRDETVIPLILNYGLPITLTKRGSTATYEKRYDPATKSFIWVDVETDEVFTQEPAETVVAYQGLAVRTKYRDEAIDGTLVKRGDVRLLAVNIPLPQLGDTIQVGDTVYNVVQTDPVAPGPTVVLYKVQVRV